MKHVDFTEALAVAALVAGGGAAVHATLAYAASPAVALPAAVTLSAGAVMAWLGARAAHAGGRTVVALTWCLAAGVLPATSPAPALLVLLHALLLWGVRAVLHQRRLLACAADLALAALALAAGMAVYLHTASFLLAAWSWGLVQAAWTWLAPTTRASGGARLARAQGVAAAALDRLDKEAWEKS
ncbi:MAG: hypothetical protein RLW62_16695 [Gammaproteobacteria bacterium]